MVVVIRRGVRFQPRTTAARDGRAFSITRTGSVTSKPAEPEMFPPGNGGLRNR